MLLASIGGIKSATVVPVEEREVSQSGLTDVVRQSLCAELGIADGCTVSRLSQSSPH